MKRVLVVVVALATACEGSKGPGSSSTVGSGASASEDTGSIAVPSSTGPSEGSTPTTTPEGPPRPEDDAVACGMYPDANLLQAIGSIPFGAEPRPEEFKYPEAEAWQLIAHSGVAGWANREPVLIYVDAATLMGSWDDAWEERPPVPRRALDCGLVRYDIEPVDGDWVVVEFDVPEGMTWMMVLPLATGA